MPRNTNLGTSTLRNRNRVTNKTRLKIIQGSIDADLLVVDEDEEKARIIITAGVDAEDADDDLILKPILCELFYIEKALEAIARDIQTKSKALAEQARARTAVVREVKKFKNAEKALEAKEPEVDAQTKHSFSELQKSQKAQERIGNDSEAECQLATLHSLRRDLSNANQAADEAAAEACRRASQHNTSLNENSPAEHRSLKASASVLAVSERQALETLSRDEKTAFRALAQEPKTKNCNGNQERLRADKQTQSAT
ncbi:hypothetical protein EDD22DRAFT_959728 [Suillus occidentalis]|nr:hypothetical protein EDD22DRAFT_959728 [Suillus occidentalis]